jgi:hypothetical protein
MNHETHEAHETGNHAKDIQRKDAKVRRRKQGGARHSVRAVEWIERGAHGVTRPTSQACVFFVSFVYFVVALRFPLLSSVLCRQSVSSTLGVLCVLAV